MSMILDALRRAESERERGAVPGLQSQQHTLIDDEEAPRSSRVLVWVVAGLVLALALAVGWIVVRGEPSRPAVVAVAPTVASPPVIAAPVVVPAPMSAPIPSSMPAPMPAPVPAATPAPVATTPVRPPAPRPAVEPRPATQRTAPAAAPAETGGAAKADGANRVYLQSELPENIRRELPRIAIGGASYSGDKASRMVIVNGQVFHEGDTIASGLVLQQIKLKAAVLAYKGWRYQIDY